MSWLSPLTLADNPLVNIHTYEGFRSALQITAERKKWAKFGLAASQGNQGVTGQHCEQIMFERTNIPKKEEKKDAATAAKAHMVRFPSG